MRDITIVSIDYNHPEETAIRMEQYIKELDAKEGLLFTNRRCGTNLHTVINVKNLDTKRDESFFKLSQLPQYIKTGYYLYIDPQARLVNPDAWDDSFLSYHYVAGAWPHHPKSFIPGYPVVSLFNSVGPGSFSLRSRLLALTVQGIFLEMSRQNSFSDLLWTHEDAYIARTLRPLLQTKGFKFAPEEVGNKFATSRLNHNDQLGYYA